MPKYSCYAIIAGGQKRIFSSWDECQAFRDKYPKGAKYKGFATKREAEEFLGLSPTDETNRAAISSDIPPMKLSRRNTAIAYTDGSYNPATKIWGYGVYLYDASNKSDSFEYLDNGSKYNDARNVAGEVFGAVRAIQEAIRLGFKKIVICHDYEGIEAWATGRWAAKKELTMWYQMMLDKYRPKIKISFQKVAAHTGEKYNEIVDGIAKRAAGI